jgi:hypothetical protein
MSIALQVRPESVVRYTPVPLVRPSFDAPMANRGLVGLMSIWNSFWFPAKAALDMRMLVGASVPAGPVAPEATARCNDDSYAAVSGVSYMA